MKMKNTTNASPFLRFKSISVEEIIEVDNAEITKMFYAIHFLCFRDAHVSIYLNWTLNQYWLDFKFYKMKNSSNSLFQISSSLSRTKKILNQTYIGISVSCPVRVSCAIFGRGTKKHGSCISYLHFVAHVFQWGFYSLHAL